MSVNTGQQVFARATIRLQGVPVGAIVEVDPSAPYVAAAIRKGYLVVTDVVSSDGLPGLVADPADGDLGDPAG